MRTLVIPASTTVRPLLAVAAGGLVLLAAACSSSHPAPSARATKVALQNDHLSSPPAPVATRTQRIVLRPVTARGSVAPGYVVSKHLDESVTCSSTQPSRAAIDNDIDECSPTAANAGACWAGPTPNTALCLRDPFATRVDLLRTTSAVPPARASKVPSPAGLVLTDGTRCTLRLGGAWAELDGHPNLYGTYACGSRAVWGPANSDGINRTGTQWTAQLAPMSGHGSLQTVTIARADFVGTAR